MSLKATGREFIIVALPESSEGRGTRQVLCVDSTDEEAVKKALAGSRLGIMGTESGIVVRGVSKMYTLDDLERLRDTGSETP